MVAAEVVSQLSPDDKAQFQDWLLHHYALAEAFCGDVLVDENGAEAITIGDAIALTRARAVQLATAKRADDPTNLPAEEVRARKIDDLIERRSFLVDQLAVELMMPKGNTKVRQQNMRAQIAEVDAALRIQGVDPSDVI